MPRRHRPDRISRRQLDARLDEVDSLIERKRWVEARDQLQALAQRDPNNVEILREWLNVSYELHDTRTYLDLCERLNQLDPNDSDLTYALASAYMVNVRPASALETYRRFLDQWPQHEHAAEARKTLTELEARMGDLLRDLGVAGERGLEIALLHERTLAFLSQGKYRQVRETAEKLLEQQPDFPPALNNIAQSYAAEGNLAPAIATTERVLALHPENYHALANMVHYHCLQGQFDQAKVFAERLKSVQLDAVDIYTRKAEAASYLGDNQAVLDAFHDAERAGHLKLPVGDPLLFHLAAVAALRLGDDVQARKYWKQALAISPGFDLAKENLDDLRHPVGERHAPWAFSEGDWIPSRTIQDLRTTLKPHARNASHDRVVADAMRRFLQQHPEMVALVPVLFDRGDLNARELGLRIAKTAQTPELLAALRDFALSQRGPDKMRLDAARVASEAGLIPQGSVRMWSRGVWRELLLLDYEFHDDPTFKHTPQVEKWLAESVRAEKANEIDHAEELLQRALAVEPDAPDLRNNLATILQMRGWMSEANALLRELVENHPDYSFPRISLALDAIKRGDLEQAELLLRPLLTRKRFNLHEFGFFCHAQIELLLAKHQSESAQSWLEMWLGIDPDNPLIGNWRQRLSGRNPSSRLLGRTW
jgi:tetratricopeptide (TPR) repeat protein